MEIIEVLVGIPQEPPPCSSVGDVSNCISVTEETLGAGAKEDFLSQPEYSGILQSHEDTDTSANIL